MKTCQYYKGTEQVGADSTRILCSYMASGGKVFKNNDPESAALIQCCWHAEKAEKECPLWNVETADTILDKPDAVPNDEDEDVDGIEFNEGEKLQMLADGFRKMSKTCPYYSSELGKVEVNSFGAMEFECEHTKMIFAEESKAGEWLERCCLAPEKCYHYRKAKEEEGQPVEQQAFTTEIAENMDTQASSERKKMAIELTSNIVVKYEIARKCIFEIARDLTRVKEERLFIEMGVGSFDEYCQKVAGFGDRQGRNFINIYKRFSEEEINEYKHLGSTKMAYMAELDDTDLGELMATHDLESVTTRELRKLVDEYKNKYEQITLLLDEEKSKNAESTSLESQVEELRKQLEAAHQANEDMESGALNAEKRLRKMKCFQSRSGSLKADRLKRQKSPRKNGTHSFSRGVMKCARKRMRTGVTPLNLRKRP